ncbi:hypothetical protein ACZ90_27550 [Streptomyces albus subsp. albus]|nr:hypothetical protein ACZ90_27550 [Streptomyces albus subsp. albus]
MAMDESAESMESVGTRVQGEAEAAVVESVTYPVAPNCRVNVRRGPSTTSPLVRVLAYDVRVQIRCQLHGEKISGPYGTTDIWDNIGPGEYISDAYVKTGSDGFVTVRCSS